MKSLTLQLITLLPLLLLLLFLTQHSQNMVDAAAEGKQTTSAHINKRTTSTTTQQPPSLRAPRLMRTPRPTTVMTHPTARTKTTTIKSATVSAPKQQSFAQTARRAAPNFKAATVTTPPSIRRPTRGADESAPTNVRQNRSFLSAAATQSLQNANADAVAPVGRSVDANKTNKQIDSRQIKRVAHKNNNNNAGQQQPGSNNSNYQNANDNVARTSAVASAAKVPATASLSPSVTSTITNTSSSGALRTTSSIDSKPSVAMTNHHQQPPLQRQSKQIANFAARTNVQRETPTLQTDNNGAGTANSTRLPQTPKSPRMIHRLVAGHIQNAEGRSTYQVSAITANSTTSNSTTHKPPYQYVRTKGGQLAMSSSYRLTKVSTTAVTPTNTAATTTATSFLTKTDRKDTTLNDDDNTDDEALLEDDGDFDSWDNGILRLSAGSGKENTVKSKKSKDESKKTLSDQVRDGKYGLIEKEIFRRPPKRPGVISYLPNKETPIDNERTFGGLNEEDIWLAEDHLLVIKGGNLNEGEPDEPWPPIDDYDAPGRQIKIPPNPKVPPPFPVQLEENGPLQFIGNNKFTVVYPIANESIPVYTAGAEANYPSTESDSDNEKNLLTRPGSAQDVAKGEPGYNYPAPSPPWLYHNQTFVNPFLNNARPISYPNLGPFTFSHNGSLDNSNGTDYFDEDDPSLYYPPAYTFVYKSNYTNPVPPGPLVPGIVLPPPANQFSRLEKPEKVHTPSRHRGYGTPSPTTSTTTTTTSTTTTSTTTTSTTTEAPYRPKVITKIHQYSPKTIIITPEPPHAVQHVQPSKQPPAPPAPAPTASPPGIIHAIPVPVAVHIPIFPSHKYPQSRPNAIAYESTTPRNNQAPLSKSNPIYYEYFEAKRQPNGVTTNVIDDFLSTTEKPALAKPIKLYATSKRPFKSQPQNQRNFLPPQLQPQRPYLPQDVVYITPKPDAVRYKRPPQVPIEPTVYKPRPLENFEEEVNAIRETLRYYQNQQLRDNNIPRTPKAKPIYEFNFDATKNLEPAQPTAGAEDFQPPAEYDEAPFKPMVTYSPPVNDENSFQAINVEKTNAQLQQQQQQEDQYSQPQQQARYQSTTTLVPIQPDTPYQQIAPLSQGRSKKLRLGAKYLQQTPLLAEYRSAEPELRQYQGNQRTHVTTQTPWVSLNQQQELNEYTQPPQYQRIERPPVAFAPKQRGLNGYYYGGPALHARQNNRFYEEPFQQRRVINYRQPPQSNYQQPQQQPQTLWSLENDTYVNYAPNRPPLNPDAEYINPYQPALPQGPFSPQLQRYTAPQQPPGPALSHQAQYYAPPQLQQQQQRQQQQQQLPPPRQYQPQIPLHRDILVNYRQPLPPINPDSEYISHPQVVRPQVYSPIYRSNGFQRLPPQLAATGEQDGLYYIAPKYRRSNNSNGSGRSNNENNNNNNNNSNNENKNNNDDSSNGSQSRSDEGVKATANSNTKTPTRSNNGNVNH
ncbi:mucin-5AC [Bactrocera oleae]|uniref:mucin-5AC n=1 Tax=Bactrocera oleae TaxID=104688 RepID=UPI00387E96AE